MYILEVMRLDGIFVPAAIGDSDTITAMVTALDIWRLYRDGTLVAESLSCRGKEERRVEIKLENVTDERWERARKRAAVDGYALEGSTGEVKIQGVLVKYKREGQTLVLDVAKPWFIPESIIKAAIDKALATLGKEA